MSESPTCLETWTPMFNISDSDWPKIFTLSFKFTIESKIQAFQFAMLHRFVVHKARLFKMQLVDSELCDVCIEKDTILHIFGSVQILGYSGIILKSGGIHYIPVTGIHYLLKLLS